MNFEANLGECYKEIAQLVNNMIPVQWETFYLSARMNDEGWAHVYFCYKVVGESDELHYSGNITREHGVDRAAYMSVLQDLIKLVRDMRQTFLDEGQNAWHSFSMIVSNRGEMNAEFGYVDWQKSDYQVTEIMNYFTYKHVDRKHVDQSEWQKMEEMAQYERK